MRMMVSLKPRRGNDRNSPHTLANNVYETPNNEADPTDYSQESQPRTNSEPMTNSELIE